MATTATATLIVPSANRTKKPEGEQQRACTRSTGGTRKAGRGNKGKEPRGKERKEKKKRTPPLRRDKQNSSNKTADITVKESSDRKRSNQKVSVRDLKRICSDRSCSIFFA